MITEIQKIPLSFPKNISLYLKREDKIHPFISGNKFRKLKYNLLHFQDSINDTLVTFGGAYSNHIAATSFACKEKGINCVGVIRGEELPSKINENPTLQFAQEQGMKFEFVSREQYRDKNNVAFLEYLESKYGQCFILPEGGTNALAVKGCEEILNPQDTDFDYICCAVGTGGTIAGISNAALPNQKIIGFPALKEDFLQNEISKFAQKNNWNLNRAYSFGGYAKVTPELIAFINQFYEQTSIPLDPVYTAKMMYGILDCIEKDYFPENAKILAIHTGGLQGIKGMNAWLENKNWTKINSNE